MATPPAMVSGACLCGLSELSRENGIERNEKWMGDLVDWAPTAVKKTAAAMTAERRSDFPTRDLPKSAAIYVDIIAARELVATRNRRRQVHTGGRAEAHRSLSCCALVKYVHRFARSCPSKFGVNMKDFLDHSGMKDNVP